MSTLEVFDDIIDKSLQEKIKLTLLKSGSNFPWFFLDDITTDEASTSQLRPGFFHLFCENFIDNSEFYSMIRPIVDNVAGKLKLKLPRTIKSRTFLQVPLSLKDHTVDNAHIDMNEPHVVFLYYVIDSDGDTIIYDKKWKSGSRDMNSKQTAKLLIKKKITPKQGRVVVFDGRYWHTAEQPKHSKRCVINNNVTYEGINSANI